MDIIEFLDDYQVEYASSGKNISSSYIGVNCPTCDQDDSFHLGIRLDGSFATCWREGPRDMLELISIWASCNRSDAYKLLKEYAGTSSAPTDDSTRIGKETASKIVLPGKPFRIAHKKYLEKRGFDPDYLEKKYGLTGTGLVSVYKDQDFPMSIIIPVHDRSNRIISFQGRDITGKADIRYKGLKEEHSVRHYKKTLYGLNHVTSDTVVLVEGVTDVWRGGDNFLCTFGTSLQPSQLRELRDFRRVLVLFDSEGPAQAKAIEYAKQLSCWGIDVENVCLDMDGKDVGDLTADEALELRRELDVL